VTEQPEPKSPRQRQRRRVTTEPPPGTDTEPAREPDRHTLTENDERLRAEKPPHY
jgi:hypothetical protein